MATELGGASIGIIIGDGTNPPPPDQFNAISNFFHGYYNQSVEQTPGPQAGEQIVTTDLGRTLHAFGDAAGPVMKLQGSGDGILGTGHGGTLKAGDGDNEIIITDNSGYTLNLNGGDDYVQSSGSGPINVAAGSGKDVIVGGGWQRHGAGQPRQRHPHRRRRRRYLDWRERRRCLGRGSGQ
jgi:hypothetical protein